MNREQANDLFKNGKTEEAIKAFQQMLEAINDSQEEKDRDEQSILNFNIGLCFKKKGDNIQALQYFTKAIEINPNYTKALYQRCVLYMHDNQNAEALADANKVLEVEPDFMKPHFQNQIINRIKQTIKDNTKRIPVTILTGFLGSGKTTLLNRILKESHGKRIAVIENEFGDVGIDQSLVDFSEHSEDQIIEVMNGCVCCTVRSDLVETLKSMRTKYIDTNKIDYIIIETTGMADPAPVLQTFLIDEEIQQFTKLDAVITVCDASQIVERLAEEREMGAENEAVEQVCFADKILLNKIDLCDQNQIQQAKDKIREFNSQCQIQEVQLNDEQIPFDKVLDCKCFNIESALQIDETILEDGQEHSHDSRIGSFSYKMEAQMTEEGANKFIGHVIGEKGANIYRMKGFIAIAGSEYKYVFHSVGMLFSCVPFKKWELNEPKVCVFVIIGKHLEQKWLEDRFKESAIQETFKSIESVAKKQKPHH